MKALVIAVRGLQAGALGCYGNCEVQAPVLDGMAAEGTRFANAFTPCPVCSPARA